MTDVYTIVIVTLLATASVMFFILWRLVCRSYTRKSKSLEVEKIVNSASLGGYYYYDRERDDEFFSINLVKIFNLKKEIKSFSQFLKLFGEESEKLLDMKKSLLNFDKSNFVIDLPYKNSDFVRNIHCVGNRVDNETGGLAGIVIWFYDVSSYTAEIGRLSAENTRVKNEAKDYLNIFNSVPVPIWLRNEDFSIKHCNITYGQVANDSSETRVGDNKIPELDENLITMSKIAYKNERPLHMKKHMVVSGERHFFDISEQKTSTGDNVVGYAIDISKQEEVEKELARHISAHADLLESSSSAMAIYGADTKLKFYNHAFVNLWDFKENWLSGNPTYSAVLENLRERRKLPEQADFAKFRNEQLKFFKDLIEPHDEFFYLPDGRALRVIVIPHALGGLLFAYEDMTDRFVMERSYNTLIEVQKETLDNLGEAIAVFGQDGALKLYNPAYAKMWPNEAGILDKQPRNTEMMELSKELFDYGDDWDAFKKDWTQRPSTKQPLKRTLERRDGKMIEKIVVALPDGDYLISYRDITSITLAERSLRERNEALEEVDQLKTEFLANVSYELRTPLTSIMGFTEMLGEEHIGKLNKHQKDYVQGVLQSSDELMMLINDILDLASIEAGYMSLEVKEFEVCEMLGSLMKLVAMRCTAAGIRLSLDCVDNIGKMYGDEKRIKQVMFNLIANSIKFIKKGGEINVSAKSDKNEEVVLAVHDSCYSSDRTSKGFSQKGGSGLGLSVVKNIVELHGGKIKLEASKGEGTKVSCTFKRKSKKLLNESKN